MWSLRRHSSPVRSDLDSFPFQTGIYFELQKCTVNIVSLIYNLIYGKEIHVIYSYCAVTDQCKTYFNSTFPSQEILLSLLLYFTPYLSFVSFFISYITRLLNFCSYILSTFGFHTFLSATRALNIKTNVVSSIRNNDI